MRRKSWDDDEEQKRTPCLALFSVSLITFICLNVIGSVSFQIFQQKFSKFESKFYDALNFFGGRLFFHFCCNIEVKADPQPEEFRLKFR